MSGFLEIPGRPGPFGAIMDEYARAAEDLCRVVERIDPETFTLEQESEDPDTTSLEMICRHCVNAAFGYSNAIRKVRDREPDRTGMVEAGQEFGPGTFRSRLENALRHTEATLDGLWDADDKTVLGLAFTAPWGQTYDPEMILEHGIVHLLRHRRQIERWTGK